MKKIITCMSIFTICIFLVPIATPLVYSQTITTQKNIPIQTVLNSETGKQKLTTYLSLSEADELRQLLISLNDALTRKNRGEIQHYETILKTKGIIPEAFQFKTTFPQEPRFQIFKQHCLPLRKGNISNTLCYLHATGLGTLVFTIGLLLIIPVILLISIFGLDILKFLLPPLLLLMIVTHLIPFRVLLPIGAIILNEGNVSTIGIAGSQKITVETPSTQVNIIGFSGITINIPSSNQTTGFLFVSGFSLYAYSQESSQNITAKTFTHKVLPNYISKWMK